MRDSQGGEQIGNTYFSMEALDQKCEGGSKKARDDLMTKAMFSMSTDDLIKHLKGK